MPGTTTALRQASLRRALWRARLTAKAFADQALLTDSERHATALLRSAVRQQLQPDLSFGRGACEVFRVENGWQAEVLRRDPEVFYVSTLDELTAMLISPEPMKVFVSRQAFEDMDELQTLPCDRATFKTVFVDFG